MLLGGFFAGRAVGASLVGVGLTGGIATGKSTVSMVFKDAGAVIVDADIVARQVVMPGQRAYREIVKVFGEEVLNADDKTINRAKLGSIIFSDPAKRQRLNACTHVSRTPSYQISALAAPFQTLTQQESLVLYAPFPIEIHYLGDVQATCVPSVGPSQATRGV